MSEEKNTMREYGSQFQTKTLGILLTDRAFLERTFDIISPDFWETDAQQWTIKLLLDYYIKYKDILTMTVIACEIKKLDDVVLQASLQEQIKNAYQLANQSSDTAYVKEQFLTFCKNQTLKNAIWEAHEYLKRGDYDSIWKVIDKATKAGMERNLGHDYFAEFDDRMAESARDVIKTNWPLVDTHLDGGIGKGDLGFMIGASGVGKSWFLVHVGAESMKQGKNVMHFTLELNEKYVGRRYDSYFSGTDFQNVRKFPDKVKESLKDIKGKLFIQYFPMNTVTAHTFKTHIERIQLIHQLKIDMVIIDYADLVRPTITYKDANLYVEGGSIYGDLRCMAGELQLPIFTASQGNRASAEETNVDATMVADSYKKIMIGDFVMSLSRTSADKIAGSGRVKIIKSRFGEDGKTYLCNFNSSNGKIEIYDEKSIEGAEILARVKKEQENQGLILGKRWRSIHSDPDDGSA